MEEFIKFVKAYPEVRFVDVLLPDLCNIARGKRIPISDVEKLYEGNFQVPNSIMLLDVTGESSDPGGRGFSDGDPDVCVYPVEGTLKIGPRFDPSVGQVLGSLYNLDGSPCSVDPRHILGSVCKQLVNDGFSPVVAIELEFYLLDPDIDSDGKLKPPRLPSTGERVRETQVYKLSELQEFSGFLESVHTACDKQGIKLGAMSAEYACGQYEINLRHVADAITAADQAVLLQRAIRCVARQHGIAATFMAKPYQDGAGSGLHVNLSLLDEQGKNVFDYSTDGESPMLRHSIGGLMAALPESMAFFAPNINSYRRFVPNLFVPIQRSWGYNNRSVAVRIPAGEGSSRRLEHRVAGADANPYLVLAAVLAGVHFGIQHQLDPGDASVGNACEEMDQGLPFEWQAAIDALLKSQVLPGYFGVDYIKLYCETKQSEHDRFQNYLSPLEFDWYLNLD